MDCSHCENTGHDSYAKQARYAFSESEDLCADECHKAFSAFSESCEYRPFSDGDDDECASQCSESSETFSQHHSEHHESSHQSSHQSRLEDSRFDDSVFEQLESKLESESLKEDSSRHESHHDSKEEHQKPHESLLESSSTIHSHHAESESKKHDCSSSSSSGCGHKVKHLPITFGPKLGHPWAQYNQGEESIYVKGINGPTLHLFRGATYSFDITQEYIPGTEARHLFVLTNSPAGGQDSFIFPGFVPVVNGSVEFTITDDLPKYFFYQDFKNEFAGGIVIVHSRKC